MTPSMECQVLHAPSSTSSLLAMAIMTKMRTDVVDTIPIACEGVWRLIGFSHDTTATGHADIESAPSPLGSAIVRMDEDEIILDADRLNMIYNASVTPEKKVRDKGASGRIRTDFPANIGDYESGRYDD